MGQGGGGGGVNERTVGLTFVCQMTLSSYRRKIRTLYLFTFTFEQNSEKSGEGSWLSRSHPQGYLNVIRLKRNFLYL